MERILTISIPTWNRAGLLAELLQQVVDEILVNNYEARVEVMVSDNASEDSTKELVQGLQSRYSFINYNRNATNIGAKSNVLKSMEMASGQYVIFMGDDDRLQKGALKKIVEFLSSHPDCGTLIDHKDFKRRRLNDGDTPSLTEYLERHYWNMGNAGFFIPRTAYFRQYLRQYGYDFFNECWPQTQIQILGLFNNPADKIYMQSIGIHAESMHGEVMQYTSLYLWRTCYYDLQLSADAIRDITNIHVWEACRRYLKGSLVQQVFNILQCGIFVDSAEIKGKTRKHILQHIGMFPSVYEKLMLLVIVIALWLPGGIAKVLGKAATYLIKGKAGLNNMNTFVAHELQKKDRNIKASKAIRQLEFEK